MTNNEWISLRHCCCAILRTKIRANLYEILQQNHRPTCVDVDCIFCRSGTAASFSWTTKETRTGSWKSTRDVRCDARARAAVSEVEDLRRHLSGGSPQLRGVLRLSFG